MGLTHAGKNRLADGNAVTYSDGLTREGKTVIRQLLENNLLLDVAHLHPQCFWELVRLSESPMISSHTGIKDIYDSPRNISLDQVKEVTMRGGVVGITFNPEMLTPSGEATRDDVFAHLDTVVQQFGAEAVGIGSDLCGYPSVTQGLEDITAVPSLIETMQGHGYPGKAVAQIMGHNWVRTLAAQNAE